MCGVLSVYITVHLSCPTEEDRWVEAIRAKHALFTSKERGFGRPGLKLLQVTVRNLNVTDTI